jgi:hypothetical protein
MKTPVILLTVLLMAVRHGRCQGPVSGFMPGARATDLALTYAHDSYDTYVFGDERRERPVTTQSVNLFAEHGFSPHFSVLATFPYLWIDENNRGVQDASLYMKYRNLYKERPAGSWTLITGLGLTFPLSNYATDTENPIGQKAVFFHGRLTAQYRLYSGFFIMGQSGLDFRLLPEAQWGIPFQLRLGWGAGRFYADGWLEVLRSLNAGVDENIQGGAGSSWTRLGGTGYFELLNNLGLVVQLAFIVRGENIGLSHRYGTGLVLKLRPGN